MQINQRLCSKDKRKSIIFYPKRKSKEKVKKISLNPLDLEAGMIPSISPRGIGKTETKKLLLSNIVNGYKDLTTQGYHLTKASHPFSRRVSWTLFSVRINLCNLTFFWNL